MIDLLHHYHESFLIIWLQVGDKTRQPESYAAVSLDKLIESLNNQ